MNALDFSLLATRKVTFGPRHDATWMEDIEYEKGTEHWSRVEAVLIRLMGGNGALEPLGVFAETEDNSHLRKR